MDPLGSSCIPSVCVDPNKQTLDLHAPGKPAAQNSRILTLNHQLAAEVVIRQLRLIQSITNNNSRLVLVE